jgi:hypothetical protein
LCERKKEQTYFLVFLVRLLLFAVGAFAAVVDLFAVLEVGKDRTTPLLTALVAVGKLEFIGTATALPNGFTPWVDHGLAGAVAAAAKLLLN